MMFLLTSLFVLKILEGENVRQSGQKFTANKYASATVTFLIIIFIKMFGDTIMKNAYLAQNQRLIAICR